MYEHIKKEAQKKEGTLKRWRRDFHRHPETAFKEDRTSSKIQHFLEDLGLSVKRMAKTGLTAELEGKPGDKVVALRADMDALPIQEEGDKKYISKKSGIAHVCGHDGHMAILMGAAKVLAGMKDRFSGKVVFLFQPAEELPPGGAKEMIEKGALEGVQAIFGLHLWQPLPTGSIGILKGPMMAQADNFEITVKGKAGHGSMPQTTVDPIFVASQLVMNIQSVVSRQSDPLKPLVISFGTIKGGTVYNIIPKEVHLTGTVRTFETKVQEQARKKMNEIAKNTCKAFGAFANCRYKKGFPPLVNHHDMVDLVLETSEKILGKDKRKEISPVMGGEDFAYYVQKIPGAFLFLGAGDGQNYSHHHPKFDIDEKVLPQGAALMAGLAYDFLNKK
ncbi:MAG: amidohydrolase [Candidatus Aminicenantes bacterium]|nr:amidohydrolase [Candidatus Aminicenantes bacterium]